MYPSLAKSDFLCYFMRALNTAMPSARDYVTDLAARGRHHFTAAEALAALGGSRVAVRAALRRRGRRSDILTLSRVPRHRPSRVPSPRLSAPGAVRATADGSSPGAVLRGPAERRRASRRRPSATAALSGDGRKEPPADRLWLGASPVRRSARPREDARGRDEHTARENPRVVSRGHRAGGRRVRGQVWRPRQCRERFCPRLAEAVEPSKLLASARLCPIAWSQRLGYLLDATDHSELANALIAHVREHASTVAPLLRAKPLTGAPRASRWKLAINETVEPDRD